ncbi:hypothetical protein RRG08_014716, partial [Elysia crispata]
WPLQLLTRAKTPTTDSWKGNKAGELSSPRSEELFKDLGVTVSSDKRNWIQKMHKQKHRHSGGYTVKKTGWPSGGTEGPDRYTARP